MNGAPENGGPIYRLFRDRGSANMPPCRTGCPFEPVRIDAAPGGKHPEALMVAADGIDRNGATL